MRRSLLVTCLLLTAWADPAGSLVEPNPPAVASRGPAVEGVADADPDAWNAPPETTRQLIEFDDVAVVAPIPEPGLPAGSSGDALAALDAVADGFNLAPASPVPIPPHRAIPHTMVCEALASAALTNDLPPPFFIRLIWQESGFRQDVVSPAGAIGVAQFMPATAAEHGLDNPFNPLQAVRASARLLRGLIQQFGNVGLAAAAYNAGPRRVQDWLAKRGELPQETQDYVERVTGKKAEDWKLKTVAAAPLRVPARAPCQREAGLYAADGPEQIPLPPIQVKAERAELPKARPAATEAASAKMVSAKTASAKTVSTKTASAKGDARPVEIETKGRSKAVNATVKTRAAATKAAGKATGKGRKVKLANADSRK